MLNRTRPTCVYKIPISTATKYVCIDTFLKLLKSGTAQMQQQLFTVARSQKNCANYFLL